MTSMATERQTFGETATKITTETTIRLKETPASTSNAKTVEKEATRLLIVGRRKEKIKTTTSTTYLWEPQSLEKFRKRKMNMIPNNG